jgi:hypothetical protein
MLPLSAVATLSDAALLDHVGALVAREQRTTAELVASLSELDARRLYLGVRYCISPNTPRTAALKPLDALGDFRKSLSGSPTVR